MELDYRDWDKLSRKLAWRFARLVFRRGYTVRFDDALSEVQLRWVHARNGFKPEFGVQFQTYFTRAVLNHVTPYVDSLKHDRAERHAVRLDHEAGVADDDGSLAHELIADDGARSPEQMALNRVGLDALGERTPMLGHFIGLMHAQPEELMAELQAARAKRDYARAYDLAFEESAVPHALTPLVLGKIFGFNWKHRLRLKQEMQEALAYVS